MSNAVKTLEFGGRNFNPDEIARKEIKSDASGNNIYYVWMKNGLHFSYLSR